MLLNLPTAQSLHEVCPVRGWYLPPSHRVQAAAPSAEIFPKEQSAHVSWLVAPRTLEEVPAKHAVQLVDPA